MQALRFLAQLISGVLILTRPKVVLLQVFSLVKHDPLLACAQTVEDLADTLWILSNLWLATVSNVCLLSRYAG